MTTENNIICISCSIFKNELKALSQSGKLKYPVKYLDSLLHIRPTELKSELQAMVDEELDNGKKVILIYGDCHSHMIDMEEMPGVVRTSGVNCCHILLGKDYRKLNKEEVFFLMPEWARRWRDVFQKELGLNDENAKSMMQDTRSRMVYLDTELTDIPEEKIKEFSEYCGLDCDIMKVSLDNLLESIENAAKKLISTETPR
jgi:hypothetical protein